MSDVHGGPDKDEVLQEEKPQRQQPAATSVKKARLRPLSEQLLGCSWPHLTQDDNKGQFILLYHIPYFILKFHYL